ncbi:MAG TPA: tRNA pseudouridine(38-40) synthase TruA [Cyclobacteriaceae bacterium]|nr:tRNA pseudouridine(38-40) synthase TruA [Cyclobacteriaceae bacterium]
MRYFFEISYFGRHYAGWQSQANAIGIQTVVEDALSKILRTSIKIVGSGRTDTGVHCVQQFFHADIDKTFETPHLLVKLNSFFTADIAIKSIRPAKPQAHARYSATERTYRYKITMVKNPFLQGLALHLYKPVDVQTMNRSASLLVGVHEFTSFSKVKTDVNHFLCEVKYAYWKKTGDELIFTITANRFLRGMVRAIVGTLLDVGTGKISAHDFQRIIASKDRRRAGANVPPHGLYLTRVKYPRNIFLKTS